MVSRLLSRLQSDLKASGDDATKLVAIAKIAAYYAKLGDCERADSHLQQVRIQPREVLSGEVLGWVNYAEGLVEHYAGRTDASREKWVRARAIALSIGSSEVSALASAWLAFSAYLSEDLDGMEREARAAISAGCTDFPSAGARLTLTLALCFHYCGRIDEAKANYRKCRLAVSVSGDEVELAALIHDMAWMSTLGKRNAALVSHGEPAPIATISTSPETAISFEELVGASTIPSLSPLLVAQDLMLNERWGEAMSLISENTNASSEEGFSRLVPGLLADRAYCNLKIGNRQGAEADAHQAVELVRFTPMHGDDLAAFHSRLATVFDMLELSKEASHHSQLAELAWKRVYEFRAKMLEIASRVHLTLNGNPVA